MSRRPIALSPDLLRLRNEGYDIDIRDGFLLVRNVPFVTSVCTIERATLVSPLSLSGDVTVKPGTHVCYWTGAHPCHADGSKIRSIENGAEPNDLAPGLHAAFTFSAKADYRNYHHKMTTYIGRIAGEAAKLDPTVTARIFPAIATEAEESVFQYVDTATSRSGIGAINSKVAGQKIAIAGLGGTGSYILDLVAKSSVAEIHLFDGDVFSQHNAFRAPGAASLDELKAGMLKVDRFAGIYSLLHRGIKPHAFFLDETNVGEFAGLDFVFVCMDVGPAKRAVIDYLVANGISFVDAGMGVTVDDGRLGGIVRVTVSTPETRDLAAPHISYADDAGQANDYTSNIQIAELNALNAALAVIRWKKVATIYRDSRHSVYLGYSIASGEIITEGPNGAG
ncbi:MULTISPECIES: ThiF family adenylyltransferase [unclassified Mesorhizobium]|uniref:ThiF family adenylyltransferase n=1 Tax=unclassified Mesorhizobium TaxID=325217 RepID=UPI0003D01C0B|nr:MULTISPECIES: ThiF family adenylyltransferase [unclassified Mesorhizobium]ESZ05288.1 thiamin biosynthesis protein [Mesorhizobium sp. L2C089B000]WJI49319.1 ThiF family adenylyltransferase [Mesorhizobium sp. C089B]